MQSQVLNFRKAGGVSGPSVPVGDDTKPPISLGEVTISSPEDIRDAAKALEQAARRAGFSVAAFHDLRSRDFIRDHEGNLVNETYFGWDDLETKWWDHPHAGLTSPVAHAARCESEPFWVDANGANTPTPNAHLRSISFKSVFGRGSQFSMGFFVPVHQAFGRIGIVCFFVNTNKKQPNSIPPQERMNDLATMARGFVSGYSSVLRDIAPIPRNCALTKRQVQCLHWASLGKTDAETSQILGVSHAAVRYHINAAMDQLECVNRTQAVFKAGQLGYVGCIV